MAVIITSVHWYFTCAKKLLKRTIWQQFLDTFFQLTINIDGGYLLDAPHWGRFYLLPTAYVFYWDIRTLSQNLRIILLLNNFFACAGNISQMFENGNSLPNFSFTQIQSSTWWCIRNACLIPNTVDMNKINVKKIAFGSKEHTTDKKMGVSVLLRLFISSNEVCNTAYAL